MTQRRRFLQASAAVLAAGPSVHVPAASSPTRLPREQAAAHALNRLGFGPRPGDLAKVADDPRAWVEQQLQPQSLQLPALLAARLDESKFTTGDPMVPVREHIERIRETMERAAKGDPAAAAGSAENPVRVHARMWQLPAIESRLMRALESPRQLEEVMVDFWFNHFNVFQGKALMRVMAGLYEHGAIRPHALGRFRDLLGATAHHPAMLYYLDNWQSVGAESGVRGRGLNENYARELMELHTLGVDGGYSQQDVTVLARMLTGWTMAAGPYQRGGRQPEASGFVFNPRLHDAGEKVWLGKPVPVRGKEEGDYALDVLARHPATAKHVAFKLAQYFVSDTPDPALVQRLAAVFMKEDGQIVPVLRALFTSDAFWSPQAAGGKFKTPYHYTLSALRAGGWRIATGAPLAGQLATQGMPLYGCQTPDGYKNTEAAWLSADAMNKRLEFASQVGAGRIGFERLQGAPTPEEVMDNLGPLVTPATRTLVSERDGQPQVALAMLLASPGMMRR